MLSMGSAVQRAYGVERLRISPAAIDLSRLDSGGISVLDSHSHGSITASLGRLTRVWFEGKTLLGRIRFNRTPSGDAAFGMVGRGEISSVSVGYTVSKWLITDEDGSVLDPETDRVPLDANLTFEAVRWMLYEVSLVAVPADSEAVFRSCGDYSLAAAKRAALARMAARTRMLVRARMIDRMRGR
ncbi:HK97 family phage prohead protease [Bradyrhizobium elkanii]